MSNVSRFPSYEIENIDSESPHLPPDQAVNSDAVEMNKFLMMLVYTLGMEDDKWYLEMWPVRFPTAK